MLYGEVKFVDKYEYKLRLEQLKKLYKEEKYIWGELAVSQPSSFLRELKFTRKLFEVILLLLAY